MLNKRAAEVRTFIVDFKDKLGVEESLTGTPTVAEIGSSALTFSGVAVKTTPRRTWAWSVWWWIPAKSQAVEFTIAGGTSGTTYAIRVTTTSDASTAQTLIKEVQVRVN